MAVLRCLRRIKVPRGIIEPQVSQKMLNQEEPSGIYNTAYPN